MEQRALTFFASQSVERTNKTVPCEAALTPKNMSSAGATSASAALQAAGVSAATTAAAASTPPITAAGASAGGGDNADEVAIELEPRDDADYETDDQSDNGACGDVDGLFTGIARPCMPICCPPDSYLYRWYQFLYLSQRIAFCIYSESVLHTPNSQFSLPRHNSFA